MAGGIASAKVLTKTERQAQALSLRLQGLSYRAIAKAINKKQDEAAEVSQGKTKSVTYETVRKDILAALEVTKQKTAAEAEYYRDIELERLNMAMSAIASKVAKGDVQAVAQWVKISESRRKLLGLDAPVQLQVAQALDSAQDQFISLLEGALDAETFAKVTAAAVAIAEASAAAETN